MTKHTVMVKASFLWGGNNADGYGPSFEICVEVDKDAHGEVPTEIRSSLPLAGEKFGASWGLSGFGYRVREIYGGPYDTWEAAKAAAEAEIEKIKAEIAAIRADRARRGARPEEIKLSLVIE